MGSYTDLVRALIESGGQRKSLIGGPNTHSPATPGYGPSQGPTPPYRAPGYGFPGQPLDATTHGLMNPYSLGAEDDGPITAYGQTSPSAGRGYPTINGTGTGAGGSMDVGGSSAVDPAIIELIMKFLSNRGR